MKKNVLVKEDACNRTKWPGVVKTIIIRNPANSVDGYNTGSTCDDDVKTIEILQYQSFRSSS